MILKSSTDSIFGEERIENSNKSIIGNFKPDPADFLKITEAPSNFQKLTKSSYKSKTPSNKSSKLTKSAFSDALKNKTKENKNDEYSKQYVKRSKVSISPFKKSDSSYINLNKDVAKKIMQQVKNVKFMVFTFNIVFFRMMRLKDVIFYCQI